MNLIEQGLALQAASVGGRKIDTRVWVDTEYGPPVCLEMCVTYIYKRGVKGIENIEPDSPPYVDILSISINNGKQWNTANWLIQVLNESLTEEIIEAENE